MRFGLGAPDNSYLPFCGLGALILFFALTGLSFKASAQGSAECLSCHERQNLAGSVHSEIACTSCHAKIKAFPHPAKRDPVDCSACHGKATADVGESVHSQKVPAPGKSPYCASCHGSHDIKPAKALSPTRCQGCHQEPFAKYKDSVHGRARLKGEIGPATCADCHEGHRILKKDDPRSTVYHLNLPRTCARCHADPALVKRFSIPIANVYQLYLDSIHGRAITKSGLLVAANCSDCHGAHDIKTKTEKDSSVFRDNIHRTCGKCHAGIDAVYVESVHGKLASKGGAGPVCTDCHTAHQIARTEVEAWKLDIVKECGTCHQTRLTSYRDTYHGKVTSLGYTRVARCSDCHGAHDILPSSDPKSRLSSANILSTCQRCHPGVGPKFARYLPHADHKDRTRYPALYYAYIFMTTLLVGVFGFFGIHLGLWIFRHSWDWKKKRWKRAPPRKDISSD